MRAAISQANYERIYKYNIPTLSLYTFSVVVEQIPV